MLTALRRIASNVRNELLFRLTGVDRRTYFDLRDLPRLNWLLRDARLPQLASPPAPDPLLGQLTHELQTIQHRFGFVVELNLRSVVGGRG